MMTVSRNSYSEINTSIEIMISLQMYCTWEIFGGGKFWQTMQVKTIGEEHLVNKQQSVHMPYTFFMYL